MRPTPRGQHKRARRGLPLRGVSTLLREREKRPRTIRRKVQQRWVVRAVFHASTDRVRLLPWGLRRIRVLSGQYDAFEPAAPLSGDWSRNAEFTMFLWLFSRPKRSLIATTYDGCKNSVAHPIREQPDTEAIDTTPNKARGCSSHSGGSVSDDHSIADSNRRP